jgi:lantibiotic modifying enzyme
MPTGLNGSGLVIYSLLSCARTLQDQHFNQLAFRAAMMIPLESCHSVRNPDVLNGAAGLLLAVLALYYQHRDARLLDRARELASGIVDCQEKGDAPAGWTVPGMHRPLLGMAHGAAGIAMALWRLHQIDADRRWSKSAHRGLEYERQFFAAKERDWPNLQLSLETPQFMTGWCAGAPGIGLARLAMRDVPDSAIGDEIEAAIATTSRHLGSGAQHLCCGESGRIVFLEIAGRMLNRPELKTQAKDAALGMVDAYAKCGSWKLQRFCERNIVPGLLDGISGIGLALLQVAAPESTPNILTME